MANCSEMMSMIQPTLKPRQAKQPHRVGAEMHRAKLTEPRSTGVNISIREMKKVDTGIGKGRAKAMVVGIRELITSPTCQGE